MARRAVWRPGLRVKLCEAAELIIVGASVWVELTVAGHMSGGRQQRAEASGEADVTHARRLRVQAGKSPPAPGNTRHHPHAPRTDSMLRTRQTALQRSLPSLAQRSFASSPRRAALITLEVDGKSVSIEQGSSIIQACELAGKSNFRSARDLALAGSPHERWGAPQTFDGS